MSVFDLHQRIITDYEQYVQRFLLIADDRVRTFVERELSAGKKLWPDALLQLSPTYQSGDNVRDLVKQKSLHPLCEQIFCGSNGLYRHQREAIEKAAAQRNYIVTSGTGSGKSLAYFIPIFNVILHNNPPEQKVRAIVVYPMNALVNSQLIALQDWAKGFEDRTKQPFPVRFDKYTGQESDEKKNRL